MSKAQDDMNCIYRDPNQPVEARVRDLLSRMTLKEKAGQMTQIERRVATPDAIKDLSIGTLSSSLNFFLIFYNSIVMKTRGYLVRVFENICMKTCVLLIKNTKK